MYINKSRNPCLKFQKYGEFCEKHKIEFKLINNNEECSICLDDNHKNKVKLGCGHIFHGWCIETWYTYKNNCPLCRQVISMTEILALTENIETSFNPFSCIFDMLFGCFFEEDD